MAIWHDCSGLGPSCSRGRRACCWTSGGFHPYTTWSTTTFGTAAALLAEAGQDAVRLGVVRVLHDTHLDVARRRPGECGCAGRISPPVSDWPGSPWDRTAEIAAAAVSVLSYGPAAVDKFACTVGASR